MIEEDPKVFRFSLDMVSFLKQHNVQPMYKDGEMINMRAFLEAESPIKLRDYKGLWSNVTGLLYEQDFLIFNNDEPITDDDYILSGIDSSHERFSVRYNFKIIDRMNVWRNVKNTNP